MLLQHMLITQQLSNEYDQAKQRLGNVITAFQEKLLGEYSARFPLRLYSKHIISTFLMNLSDYDYLPSREKYIEYLSQNEFFEIALSFSICKQDTHAVWQCPYPINIHKVTKYIAEHNIQKEALSVSYLSQLINPECFDEFDDYMVSQQYWSSITENIKANNPIIVLRDGDLVGKSYLINGTHRTIQAIKDAKETVEVFVVPSSVCKICGITREYENLYAQILDMCNKAYGLKKGGHEQKRQPISK
jgi:hypothetical protein